MAEASVQPTRRERQREATYAEIVSTSRTLLAEGAELSLRAVAGRMGMTAPALYRYVASYQELVDLVAFEIDKAATIGFRAAAARHPEDDPRRLHAGLHVARPTGRRPEDGALMTSRRTIVNLVWFGFISAVFVAWAVGNILQDYDPRRSPYALEGRFASSVGLLPGNEVAYLGVPIGNVR